MEEWNETVKCYMCASQYSLSKGCDVYTAGEEIQEMIERTGKKFTVARLNRDKSGVCNDTMREAIAIVEKNIKENNTSYLDMLKEHGTTYKPPVSRKSASVSTPDKLSADTTKTQKKCASCDKNDRHLKLCGGCRKVWFCGKDCQAKMWPRHKAQCQGNDTTFSQHPDAR